MKHGYEPGILYQQDLATGRFQQNGKSVVRRVGGKEVADGHVISYNIKSYRICGYSFIAYGIFLALQSICWMNLLNE